MKVQDEQNQDLKESQEDYKKQIETLQNKMETEIQVHEDQLLSLSKHEKEEQIRMNAQIKENQNLLKEIDSKEKYIGELKKSIAIQMEDNNKKVQKLNEIEEQTKIEFEKTKDKHLEEIEKKGHDILEQQKQFQNIKEKNENQIKALQLELKDMAISYENQLHATSKLEKLKEDNIDLTKNNEKLRKNIEFKQFQINELDNQMLNFNEKIEKYEKTEIDFVDQIQKFKQQTLAHETKFKETKIKYEEEIKSLQNEIKNMKIINENQAIKASSNEKKLSEKMKELEEKNFKLSQINKELKEEKIRNEQSLIEAHTNLKAQSSKIFALETQNKNHEIEIVETTKVINLKKENESLEIELTKSNATIHKNKKLENIVCIYCLKLHHNELKKSAFRILKLNKDNLNSIAKIEQQQQNINNNEKKLQNWIVNHCSSVLKNESFSVISISTSPLNEIKNIVKYIIDIHSSLIKNFNDKCVKIEGLKRLVGSLMLMPSTKNDKESQFLIKNVKELEGLKSDKQNLEDINSNLLWEINNGKEKLNMALIMYQEAETELRSVLDFIEQHISVNEFQASKLQNVQSELERLLYLQRRLREKKKQKKLKLSKSLKPLKQSKKKIVV